MDTMAGGRAGANLYELIEAARANQTELWACLNHLFEILPAVSSAEQIEPLLAHRLDPAALSAE
jgi:hypothetical protein